MRPTLLACLLLLTVLAAAQGAEAKPLVDTVCDQIGGCYYPQEPCSAAVQVFCGGGGGTCLVYVDLPRGDYCL
jgi:hypothetical protein